MSEESIRSEIAPPWMAFGSDAGSSAPEGVFPLSVTHSRAYGNFARLLGKYVRDVIVNDEPVLLGGEHTGATPGRFVKGPGYAR